DNGASGTMSPAKVEWFSLRTTASHRTPQRPAAPSRYTVTRTGQCAPTSRKPFHTTAIASRSTRPTSPMGAESRPGRSQSGGAPDGEPTAQIGLDRDVLLDERSDPQLGRVVAPPCGT